MNYLMIKLKDKRMFLTNQKNLGQLIEFANTFKAELCIVKTNSKNIKSLSQLAVEICDTNSKQESFEYKIVKKITKYKNNKIFENIVNALKNKKTIDICKIKNKFSKKGIDEKNIRLQILQEKKHIKKIGFTLKKIAKDKYKIA